MEKHNESWQPRFTLLCCLAKSERMLIMNRRANRLSALINAYPISEDERGLAVRVLALGPAWQAHHPTPGLRLAVCWASAARRGCPHR